MELSTRRRFRRLSWVIFFLLTPSLLAYVLGYRVAGTSLKRLGVPDGPAVGALVVRTLPAGAQVILDGRIVDERTPSGLGSIPEGSHRVQIRKAGYRAWEKRLDIEGGQVHFLLSVRLLPETVDEEIVRTGGDFSVSPNERWLVVQESEALRVLPFRTADREAGVRIVWSGSSFPELSWAPDGSIAVLVTAEPNGSAKFLGTLVPEPGRVTLGQFDADFLGWVTTGTTRALLLDDRGQLWAHAGASENRVRVAQDVLTASAHPRGIVIARSRSGEDGADLLLLVGGRMEDLSLPLPEPPRVVLASPKGALAAVGARTNRLFVLPPDEERWRALAPITGLPQWSPDGDKLLYQETPFDAWVLNVSEERSVLPEDVPELLIRLSTKISGLKWFAGSQHVLFLQHDILQLLDIDPRAGHRVDTLTSTNQGESSVFPVSEGTEVYVATRRENQETLLRLLLRVPEDR